MSFAPTGKLLAAAVPDNLLFYDTDTGKLVHSEKTHPGWVMSLRWSPDGKRIYVGTSPVGLILAACSIKKLREYFADCGKDKWDLSVRIGSEEQPAGTGAWSHDSKSILIAGWQRQASIWDTATGQRKQLIRDKQLKSNPLDYLVSDIAASADGERIAVGAASGRIHIFDAHSRGKVGFSLELEKSLNPIDKKSLIPYSLAFDPQNHDRLFAAYMSSPRMFLWKIDENLPSASYMDEESGPVWRIACDREGKFLACVTNDNVVRLWKSPDSDSAVQLRGHISSHCCPAILPGA